MIRSYKTELKPNNKQRTLFEQNAGTARFTYNWAMDFLSEEYLNRITEQRNHIKQRKIDNLPDYTKEELLEYKKSLYAKYVYPDAIKLHKILNAKKDLEFPWMREVSKWCPQNALIHIEDAYKRFFKNLKLRSQGKYNKNKLGFPKKKKKYKKDSFTLDNPIHVYKNKIQLPKIGKVRLKELGYIPEGSPKSATISRKADKWFISVSYEIENPETGQYTKEVLGIDLGIKSFVHCSDGTVIKNSKKLKELEDSLKRQQRKLSKEKKGSNSRKKTKNRISKLHLKIANSRKDLIHKTTTLLAKTKSEGILVIEDLNVFGMMKNHKLAKAVGNVGMYEFRRQLEYKCKLSGKRLVIADRWFASSKMCSCCKKNEELELKDRIFKCSFCGLEIDRDLNASLNLKEYVKNLDLKELKNTVRYTGINAGGEERFIDKGLDFLLRCSSAKPEENINLVKF